MCAAYQNAVVNVAVFDTRGKVVPTKTVMTNFGIRMVLPEVLYVDSFAYDEYYTFQVRTARQLCVRRQNSVRRCTGQQGRRQAVSQAVRRH